MSEFTAESLLKTPTVSARDIYCLGSCKGRSAEECATATQLVFPYRGVYVRHLGRDQAVAEANQVLFFNAAEGYRVSHPAPGGDASLTLVIHEPQLLELAPRTFLQDGAACTGYRHRVAIWRICRERKNGKIVGVNTTDCGSHLKFQDIAVYPLTANPPIRVVMFLASAVMFLASARRDRSADQYASIV